MNLKQQILEANDLPTETIPVPEWGMSLTIRAMNGCERDGYEADLIEMKDLPLKEKLRNMRARLVVLCIVDDEGNRVFDNDDIEALGKKSGKALTRLSDAAQILNAMGDKEVEELAKN